MPGRGLHQGSPHYMQVFGTIFLLRIVRGFCEISFLWFPTSPALQASSTLRPSCLVAIPSLFLSLSTLEQPPTRIVISGQIFRYCKEHQPTGLFRKCGYPGGCDRVASHVPPLLCPGAPAATSGIKAKPLPAATTDSSCPPSVASLKADGESDVTDGSNRGSDNDSGDAGAGGVTIEARSGYGANSGSIPAAATGTVSASDGVGSAATVAVNGEGETAVDTSGASSSGAGVYPKVEKGVSSGDGEDSVPLSDVDTPIGVGQPTRCFEHAGPGWQNIYGEDNEVGGLEVRRGFQVVDVTDGGENYLHVVFTRYFTHLSNPTV